MSLGPEFLHAESVYLNERLPGRISKVEAGSAWIALSLHPAPAGGEWLFLSWGAGSAGCCVTDSNTVSVLKDVSPARTPLFEALKSRLLKGQLIAVRQLNFDRVLEFEFVRMVAAGFSIKYFLVLEATEPTANLVLLNDQREIEETARHVYPAQNSYRTILPGRQYVLPPSFEGVVAAEMASLTFAELSNVKGVGRPLLRVIEAHWEDRSAEGWLSLLRSVYDGAALRYMRTAKGYVTAFPFAFAECADFGSDIAAAARSGVTAPLLDACRLRLLHELDLRVQRVLRSRERHLEGLQKQLKNNRNAEQFRRKGELILASLDKIKTGDSRVTLSEWNGGEPLEIELDPRLSPSRNADRYFKKYKKAKVDPVKLCGEIDSIRSGMDELREQHDLLSAIDDYSELETAARDVMEWVDPKAAAKRPDWSGRGAQHGKRQQDTPPHLRFEVAGCLVLVGLSARGNRFVTFKQAVGEDIWLHAHEVTGAHVIVKGVRGRKELEESDLLAFAASLAAAYSKGKTSNYVQVDYTERRYVRSVPGEAIALVTYTNPGTIRISPQFWREFLAQAAGEDTSAVPPAGDM